MSLESIVNAAKSVLQDAVSSPSADPVSDRNEVLEDMDLAEKAWATDGVHSGTWFVRDGEYVAFTPTTRNGATLTIGGQTTNFIPTDRFADYLVNMRSAIKAGEFDREIEGALHGSANFGGLPRLHFQRQEKAARKISDKRSRMPYWFVRGRNPDGSLSAVVGSRS
ncbi:hypothetical protein NHF48_023490 [Sphingomonas sp. H160509]|uniref:hypothetical protein n=1 Tax=Sphingomonas sp. H160509 TaxID=2955313 RepID=UPI0020975F45|nr:hypothetical protein [Sphingomonas sp. H160509]MDD1453228.1 hypothetical protein [Sphingomonas sp. H160509]